MTHPMQEAPDRGFWLDELLALDFTEIAALPDDYADLWSRLRRSFRGDRTKEVLERALDWFGRTPEVAKNLLILSKWLSGKPSQIRSDAVGEVARRCLPAEVLESYRYVTGDYQRHALATMLYADDPDRLFEIDQWNRVEDFRRGVFRMEGPRKKLPRDWAAIPWQTLLDDAAKPARSSWSGKVAPPQLHRVSYSADGTMVLLGLRRASTRSGHRDRAGRISTGRKDAWTFLLVQDDGRRIEVGGVDDEHLAEVVGPLGCALYEDDVTYRLAVSIVTSRDLEGLLARLLDPAERTIPLLEITAEFPEDWNRTVLHLANSGQVSVRQVVVWLRRAGSRFGMDWREVRSVHVGFQDRYRIQIHFPPPDGPKIVSFSQVGRKRASNEEFRRFWKEEVGFNVYAKNRLEKAAWLADEKPPRRTPRRLKEAHWDRLLRGTVANPEHWEQQALRDEEAVGVVRLRRLSWFLCGSPAARARGAGDTLDCDGEVEFDWRQVDPNDPLRVEDDRAVFCSAAGKHAHHPLRDRIPLQRRMRVEVNAEGVFARVLGLLSDEGVEEEAPGVGGGWSDDADAVVVVAVEHLDPRRLDPSLAAQANPCWVLLPGQAAPEGCEDRCVPLARVLAEGGKAITAVWKSHRAGQSSGRRGRRPAPKAAQAAQPGTSVGPLIVSRPPRPVHLVCDPRGRLLVDGKPLFSRASRGVALFLALLWKAAQKDREDGEREFPGAPTKLKLRHYSKIVSLAPRGWTSEGKMANWLLRLKQGVEALEADLTMADLLVQGGPGMLRLADDVTCEGFDVASLPPRKGST